MAQLGTVTIDRPVEVPLELAAELAALLDRLRARGLALGPREEVQATALLSHLLVAGGAARATAALWTYQDQLAPILARTTDDRRIFFAELGAARADPHAPPPTGTAIRPSAVLETARTSKRGWLVALFLSGLLIIAGWVAFSTLRPARVEPRAQLSGVDQRQGQAGVSAPTNVADATSAPAAFSPAPTPAPLARLWAAAARYNGAPTLAEIAHELAPGAPVAIAEQDYAARLAALTATSPDVPLPIGMRPPGFNPAASTETRVATALAMLDPARGWPGSAALGTAIGRGPPREGPSIALAQRLISARARFACGDDIAPAVAAAKQAGRAPADADPAVVARAIALSDPTCRPSIAPWRPAPTGRVAAPAGLPAIAAFAVLLMFLPWVRGGRQRRKAYLRNRTARSSPLRAALFRDLPQLAPEGSTYRRSLSALQRRVISESATEYDVDATIDASTRVSTPGGIQIVPVPKVTRRRPSYLVLVERLTRRDQQAELMVELMRPFNAIVEIEIFAYQNGPGHVDPIGGGPAVPIEELVASRPGHRLIVLGTGDGFFDALSGQLTSAATRLARWDHRVLLSPRPAKAWSGGETGLSVALGAPLGPATPGGLAALAPSLAEIDAGPGYPRPIEDGDTGGEPLPSLMRNGAITALAGPTPDAAFVRDLIAQLRTFLDEPAFDWLCALAVYPSLDWALTLHLGQTMRLDSTGINPTPLLTWPRAAALTRLPWFRQGRMPLWVRRALMAELGDRRGEEVRRILLELVAGTEPVGTGVPRSGPTIGRETAPNTSGPPRLEDEVLLDFLARGPVDGFAVPRPPPDRPHPRSGLRIGSIELGLAALGAALAWAIWVLTPTPTARFAPTDLTWLPVLAMLTGAAILPAAVSYGWRLWPETTTPRGRAWLSVGKVAAYLMIGVAAAAYVYGSFSVAGDASSRTEKRGAGDDGAVVATDGKRFGYVDADGRTLVIGSNRFTVPDAAPVIAFAFTKDAREVEQIAAVMRDGRIWFRPSRAAYRPALFAGAVAVTVAIAKSGTAHVSYVTADGTQEQWWAPSGNSARSSGGTPITAMVPLADGQVAKTNAYGFVYLDSGWPDRQLSAWSKDLPGGAVTLVPRPDVNGQAHVLAVGWDGMKVDVTSNGSSLFVRAIGRDPALARGPAIPWSSMMIPEAPAPTPTRAANLVLASSSARSGKRVSRPTATRTASSASRAAVPAATRPTIGKGPRSTKLFLRRTPMPDASPSSSPAQQSDPAQVPPGRDSTAGER